MIEIYPWLAIPESELRLHFTRSSGPGGQNVNKVETRVELSFNVMESPALTPRIRERMIAALQGKLDSQGVLHVAAQESRSQWKNREEAIRKFAELLRKALAPVKRRRATGPTFASRHQRVKKKRIRSAAKQMRRRPSIEE